MGKTLKSRQAIKKKCASGQELRGSKAKSKAIPKINKKPVNKKDKIEAKEELAKVKEEHISSDKKKLSALQVKIRLLENKISNAKKCNRKLMVHKQKLASNVKKG